jgi:thiosulfate reductase cytochrome b subunit
MNRVYMYSVYQRIWHWIQAAIIVLLILTGLEIHLPDSVRLLGFALAVRTHNIAAAILLANAFLGFIYYLVTGEIRQLLPQTRNLLQDLWVQVRYYTSGIFKGAPHPFVKLPESRLNPLQRITYVMVLNVLLPLQAVTGVMIWGAQYWGAVAERWGGLRTLAAVHSLGAWLFCAFLILHLYLITTGRTPAANLQAMVTGWDELEPGAQHPKEHLDES